MDIAERVQAGIDALDEHFGDIPWVKDIDLDVFDFESVDNCVLGQLFDYYDRAPYDVRTLGHLNYEWSFSWHVDRYEDIPLMHDEWYKRIEAMQGEE